MEALYKNFFKLDSAAKRQDKIVYYENNVSFDDSLNKRFPIIIDNERDYHFILSLLEPLGIEWRSGQRLSEYNPFLQPYTIEHLKATDFHGNYKKMILTINNSGILIHDEDFIYELEPEFNQPNLLPKGYSFCTVAEFKRIYIEDIGPTSLISARKHPKLTNPSFLIRKDDFNESTL